MKTVFGPYLDLKVIDALYTVRKLKIFVPLGFYVKSILFNRSRVSKKRNLHFYKLENVGAIMDMSEFCVLKLSKVHF